MPSADLLLGTHWNGGAPLDENVLTINDSLFCNSGNYWLYWPYYKQNPAGSFHGDPHGSVGLASSGTKWGLSQCLDLGNAATNWFSTRDSGYIFGRPTDVRIYTIQAWIKPAYSGTPTTSVGFFAVGDAYWGGGTYNAGVLYHSNSDGKLKWLQMSGTHAVAAGTTASASAWSPTAGEWSLVEIGFDYVNGNQYLFIDGVLVGTSSIVSTGITSYAREWFLIGSPDTSTFVPEGSLVTDHQVQEVTLYDGIWHSSSYTVDDRPMREKFMEMGEPFVLDYARDVTDSGVYVFGALPKNGSLLDCGIDTANPKFGGGALYTPNSPTFPALEYIDDSGNLLGALGERGAISYWFRQDGTPTFADEQYHALFRADNGLDVQLGDDNVIQIYQQTNGDLYVQLNHSAGVTAFSMTAVNPFTTGTWHHVEVDFEVSATAYTGHLFVDGIEVASYSSGGGTARGANLVRLTIGNDKNGGGTYADFAMDEFLVWTDIQHTSNFTPPTSEVSFLSPPAPIDDPVCTRAVTPVLGRDELVQEIARIVTGGQISYFKFGEGGWIPRAVYEEGVATADGSATVSGVLGRVPVVHHLYSSGNLYIKSSGGQYAVLDKPHDPYDGTGDLLSNLSGSIIGTVNYKTGAFSFTWPSVIPGGTVFNGEYKTRGASSQASYDIDKAGGSAGPFAVTLPCYPVVPGSMVVFDNGGQEAFDDGAGGFTGDASGSINYVTGAITFTWNSPTDVGFQTRATWEIDGLANAPTPGLTDLVSEGDSSLYTFRKDLVHGSPDIVFQGAGTGIVRVTMSILASEANDDGFGNSPFFFEGGLFTENDVMVSYFTFPKTKKDATISIDKALDLVRAVL